MAVLPDCPGLKAEVVVNGEALLEYDDDEHNGHPRTVTKYVEAISGANFEIHLSFELPFPKDYGMMVFTKIDGITQNKKIIGKERLFESVFNLSGAKEHAAGSSILRKYRFSALIVDKNNSDHVSLKHLGEIALEFHRITNIRSAEGNKLEVLRESNPNGKNVSEKAIGGYALSHYTSLDERQPANVARLCCTYVDKEPFAMFIFKYRSLRSLKGLRIIPRTPSPIPELRPGAKHKSGSTFYDQWKDLSLEDIKVLLNHHTGGNKSWNGLSREELEVLLNYHSKKSSNGKETDHSFSEVKIKDEDDDVIEVQGPITKRLRRS